MKPNPTSGASTGTGPRVQPARPGADACSGGAKKSFAALREGLVVVVGGVGFAFAANSLSPHGLSLTRNYFPGSTRPVLARPAPVTGDTNSPTATARETLTARLQAKGLQLVSSNHVLEWFRDPRYALELVVFVDARDDRHYLDGHIPGALQFDHYRAENYLAAVLPVCQVAEQIVVYCNGGDCEDSEFTALTLTEAGVDKTKLSVYGGGMTEWTALGWPVETGPRNSGQIRNPLETPPVEGSTPSRQTPAPDPADPIPGQ
jgi:rhodanese-related sulfurtransferase